jgi:hypothetical protein
MEDKTYFLLDGAMLNGIKEFLPQPPKPYSWMRPLVRDEDPGSLYGPVLIDAQAAHDLGELEIAHGLCRANFTRLHLSYIFTPLEIDEVVAHFRQFLMVWLEDRTTLMLRFADCRCLPAFSRVLTPGQWRSFVEPLSSWEYYTRTGERQTLPPADKTVEPVPAAWVITLDQTEAFMDEAEPDSLLHGLGYSMEDMRGNLQAYWDTAKQCLTYWQKNGTGNRNVLDAFARKVFEKRSENPHEWEAIFAAAQAEYGRS